MYTLVGSTAYIFLETGTTTDSEHLIMNTLVTQNQCIECNQSHDVRDNPGDKVPIFVNIFMNRQRNVKSTKVFLYKSNLYAVATAVLTCN